MGSARQGCRGKTYKAFELKDADVYRDGRVQVIAQNGDLITFQMGSNAGHQDHHLSDTDSAILPVVCLEDRPDVSWLEGVSSGDYHIRTASQITRFMMDKDGASVKSMAHTGLKRSMRLDHKPIIFIHL